MGEPARPKLTPGLWADILAKYGALGRPLTDDELRAILRAGCSHAAGRGP